MSNQQYLKALKRALGNLKKHNRDEIIKEIQSHIQDIGESESLENKFGNVNTLAKKYLGDVPLAPPLHRKVGRFASKTMAIIGIFVLIVLTALAALAWYWSQDAFNYADESSKQLTYNKNSWQKTSWSELTTVEIDQSQVVLYWHKEDTLRWKCAREQSFDQGKLHIKQNNCLVYLPMHLSMIRADQARLILVHPLADATINITQSQLQMAENTAILSYQINAERSEVAKFQSDINSGINSDINSGNSADVKIAITSFESSIEHYKY